MTMTPEQLDALVQRLEKYARREPANYKFRVGLLAALGYAYVFLVFMLLMGIIWMFRQLVISAQPAEEVMTQLNVVTAAIVFSLVGLFWVSFPPPKGVELKREQAPQLFELVDELTTKLEAPQFHHLVLDNQLNAAVFQVPRLGFLGWQRNYLIIGLPLMQALSPEQFRATLAHELAHLSGNHSRFSGWIYRIRNTWYQLVDRLETEGRGGSFLFEPFFKWYAPFFSAYSFVLRRVNEYEADHCSAELAGAHNSAEELINLYVKGYFLQQSFWPSVYKQALQLEEPPDGIIAKLLQQLQTELNAEDARRWLDLALLKKTNNEDTHPCLSDRLSALGYLPAGYEPPLPPLVEKTAAEHFLGEKLESFIPPLEAVWKKEIAPVWKQLHISAQQRLQQLETLEAKAQNQSLTTSETWKLAQLTNEFQGKDTAKPLLAAILAQELLHPGANYQLGEWLLEEKAVAGVQHLEIAIAQDFNFVIPSCNLLSLFFKQQGDLEKAEAYQEKAQLHYNSWKQAREERASISYRDSFSAHNLPDAEVQQLVQQLCGYPWVREAYFVKKVVTHFPEKPLYVLGITRRFGQSEGRNFKHDHELVAQLSYELNFGGEVEVVMLSETKLKLKQAIGRIKDSLIYRR